MHSLPRSIRNDISFAQLIILQRKYIYFIVHKDNLIRTSDILFERYFWFFVLEVQLIMIYTFLSVFK